MAALRRPGASGCSPQPHFRGLGNARCLPLQFDWGSCFPVVVYLSRAIPEKGIILSDLLFWLAVVQDKAFFLSVPPFFRPVIQKTGLFLSDLPCFNPLSRKKAISCPTSRWGKVLTRGDFDWLRKDYRSGTIDNK